MYPDNTAIALKYLGYSEFEDFSVQDAGGQITVRWSAGAPQPTEQEVLDALASQAFADWHDEHGGDSTKTLRRLAREAIDASVDRDVALRAAVIELVAYSRHIATNHNDLLAWLGTQTTLTNRAALNGFATLTPTNAEARQAIKDRIDAGEADT